MASGVAGLLEQADRSTRTLAAQLAPAVLSEVGLLPALEWLAEEIKRMFGLAVAIEDDGLDKPLSQEARSIIYRAVRELLINVSKHAKVVAASVAIRRLGDQLIVAVVDQGVGLDSSLTAPKRGGLVSLRERLSLIGGTLDLQRTASDYTLATLAVPLTGSDSANPEHGLAENRARDS